MPEIFQPYFVLLIIGVVFFMIYLEWLKPAVSFLLAALIFVIFGILNTEQVLSGFANSSIASIILMILISAGIRKNFRFDLIFNRLFRNTKTYRSFLTRMMSMAAMVSSFIPNTPVVALLTPYVYEFGKKNRIPPSKLLIPLSYATIMGGMITLIGTSTTLVLNGLLIDQDIAGLNVRDLFLTGLAVSVTGIIFIAYTGNRLLPDRSDSMQDFSKNQRQYLIETILSPQSPLVNKSIREAGLRNLQGVYLVEIGRHGRIISPVEPQEMIEDGDILIFAGDTDNIMDLIHKQPGLKLPDKAVEYHRDKNEVIEVIVAANSNMISQTVKEANFRQRYDAAIIAVHRNGERISGKIGDIRLKASDVLLVYAGTDFQNRVDTYRDIYIISKISDITDPGRKKYYAIAMISIFAIILFITKGLELFPSLLIIFSIFVGFGMLNSHDARRELDLNLVGLLVFSLALGNAMVSTGAGNLIAGWMIDLLKPFGNIGLLIGIILVTNVLTQIVVNVGAISITFPIAYAMSQNLGIEGTPFYIAIAFAASGAFLTPIGYQTNIIIYGPGGYTFRDFIKIGLPVVVVYLITAVIVISLIYRNIFW
jgi:di/tricarboxylate transporter